ncbi:MAG: beta-lactamase family protein [Pseudomonadales bacterium]|nr:beta-lactamase family protein [Pseudomonadales bacterium]
MILKDNKILDTKYWGFMDIESAKPTQPDTIFRIFSNTKIIISVAALCLYEDDCFDLDEPIEKYLPQFSKLKVLIEGAKDPSETEPLKSKPTIRQLMCHNAGFSYGIFAESVIDPLYLKKRVLDPQGTLSSLVDSVSEIPLSYQPGTKWQYSVSTDILARLIEIWSGKSVEEFLNERIFTPLKMVDTGFHVPPEKHNRLAANYAPADMLDTNDSKLVLAPDTMTGGYLEPKPLKSGGGGLVSTIVDYTRFIQMLIAEGKYDGGQLLKTETVKMMRTNQLPEGIKVVLPLGSMPETVFGLGVAIKTIPAEGEPEVAIGEYHWGGLAGTHTWISPKADVAALIFTQRLPGFWHPFSHDYKRLVYQVFTKT